MNLGDFLINWIATAPVTAVPYALAALGLIVAERSGVLNLTAEGLMLIGALAGAGSSLLFVGHPAVALLAAMVAASVVSLLFAVLVVVLRINQVIAGLSVVFFCQGLTGLIGTLAKWPAPCSACASARSAKIPRRLTPPGSASPCIGFLRSSPAPR